MLRFDKKEKKKETKGSKSLLIKDRVIINNKMQGEGNHIDTDKSSTGMRVTLPHINLNYLSNANKANKAYCVTNTTD